MWGIGKAGAKDRRKREEGGLERRKKQVQKTVGWLVEWLAAWMLGRKRRRIEPLNGRRK